MQIVAAFPAETFSGAATDCDCDECAEIGRGVSGKRWTDLSAEFLDFTCSPVLLTAGAFQSFLAAWLIRALADLAGKTSVLEFTVYSLCPPAPDEGEPPDPARERRWAERTRLMNAEQITAIRAFLDHVRRNASARDRLAPYIGLALQRTFPRS